MFAFLMFLFCLQKVSSSIKIECGNSIDAAFWALDSPSSDYVHIFSGSKYYTWNTSNNTLESSRLINDTWKNLPSGVDAACSFYFRDDLYHIFLRGDHFWLYNNYRLKQTDLQSQLFSVAVPREPDCFTCDPIGDQSNPIGFTTIGRNSHGSRACSATFDGSRFSEKACTFKTDETFNVAFNKAGYCKALATISNKEGRSYIYFGNEKIAIGSKGEVVIEPLEMLVDCNYTILSALRDPTVIVATSLITLLLILVCIVCIACICKHCGKKYEADSESDFTEKPATVPSVTAADSNET